MQNTHPSFFENKAIQMTLKLAMILFLILLLMIPKFMMMDLIEERKNYGQTVKSEIYNGWGGNQIVSSPMITIPYVEILPATKTSSESVVTHELIIMPSDIEIKGEIDTMEKKKSIYEALLYETKLKIKGKFKIPKGAETGINSQRMQFDKANLTLHISDLKGVKDQIKGKWGSTDIGFSPGANDIVLKYDQSGAAVDNMEYSSSTGHSGTIPSTPINTRSGLNSNVTVTNDQEEFTFEIELAFRGSENLHFAPLARNNKIHIESKFPHPSFTGGFLPSHVINAEGFTADWQILEYNKTAPNWQIDKKDIEVGNTLLGVKIQPLQDQYTTIHRTAKYMMLIIGLTFLVVFLTEVIQKSKVHVFQYTLIGLALVIFFSLLLSISEVLGYDTAFAVAVTATIGLIYLYSTSVYRNRKSSLVLLALLILIFGYVYMIIQLEQSSLLVGSTGLFVILAATMYATRKINWFEKNNTDQPIADHNIEQNNLND